MTTTTTDPAVLLTDLERDGFTLSRAGDRLTVQPASKLTDAQRVEIVAHKPALVALLADRATVPTYCHGCGRAHRTWRALAKCRWRKAEWVSGNGRFASVSYCPRGITVQLYADRVEAEQAKAFIDRLACGGRCIGPSGHKIADLGPNGD
jgi:hypothetical protein